MRLRRLRVKLFFTILVILAGGCGSAALSPVRVEDIQGRWKVMDQKRLSKPGDFFWGSMDYVQFQADGQVASLINWPGTGGSDIQTNMTAKYSLVGERRIELSGYCLDSGPCTGVYTVTLQNDWLWIFNTTEMLTLQRAGPPDAVLPPRAQGPSPSPTPAALK